MPAPDLSDMSDKESLTQNTDAGTFDINTVSSLVKNTANSLSNKRDLLFMQNPFEEIPAYESLPTEKITYLPISQLSGDEVSIYKKFKDLNGGILQDKDKVLVTVTILALKDNTKISYAEKIT
jgi:hypothetical protein